MKWFKHMANAGDDEFIEWLEENYGFEGSGRWWRILEIIAKAMEKNRMDPSASHTWLKWQSFLRGKRYQLLDYLLAIEQRGKIKVEQNEFVLKITCPKILKMRDEYSRKSGHSPDTYPDKLRTVDKETETDIDKESKQEAQAPLKKNIQSKISTFILPDWVPKKEWEAFKEMRKQKRRPMTPHAEDLAIKELKVFKDRGLDIKKIIDQSIMNSWSGLFPIKTEKSDNNYEKKKLPQHLAVANYKLAE